MKQKLEEQLRIAESFVDTAKFLDATLRQFVIGGTATSVENRRDKQQLQGKEVCHFLHAVVFEIGIKVIWALDKGKEYRRTHDILCLYWELSSEKRSRIKDLYDEQVSVLSVEGTNRGGKTIRVDSLVDFQSLEEALESNKDTITNFKYDGKFSGKSSAISGVIWDSTTLWVFPQGYVMFPEKLLTYARENLASYSATTK